MIRNDSAIETRGKDGQRLVSPVSANANERPRVDVYRAARANRRVIGVRILWLRCTQNITGGLAGVDAGETRR